MAAFEAGQSGFPNVLTGFKTGWLFLKLIDWFQNGSAVGNWVLTYYIVLSDESLHLYFHMCPCVCACVCAYVCANTQAYYYMLCNLVICYLVRVHVAV